MKQIGNYFIDETPLGSGGMGNVYRGQAPSGMPIAIKEILPEFVADIEYRTRIESEIQFLRKLDNDNIVKIHDNFESDGKIYIVMELVDGMNLEQYVAKNGRLKWQDSIKIMLQLLTAMQDVHEHGIVHRDIKPGNIMIRNDGRVCLLDFGVAKDLSGSSKNQTVLGTTIGTDGYMSPEQAQGLDIDQRSDIYGLGCVLYFMITGTHAFSMSGKGGFVSELNLLNAITSEKFPKLSDKVKGVPSTVQNALLHAVDKNMIKRYQSCREFANDLSRLLPGGTQINSANRSKEINVSIGRENCDVCVGVNNIQVSRHHGEIRLKNFTGGRFYVYTDTSSNGTLIDGKKLTRGMSYTFPSSARPTILLAGNAACQVDLDEVDEIVKQRIKEIQGDDVNSDVKRGKERDKAAKNQKNKQKDQKRKDSPHNRKPSPADRQMSHRPSYRNPANSFDGAIASCLKKYANFTGRASRAEFWWFNLFCWMVSIAFGALFWFFPGNETLYVMLFFDVALILPALAVLERRLHDIGKSGWNFFMILIPVFGIIYLFILTLQKSQSGSNKYGPEP